MNRTGRRNWTRVELEPQNGGLRLLLDGQGMRLPGGAALRPMPRALAEAVAAELSAAGGGVIGGVLDVETMEQFRLACTAQERVAPRRDAVIATLLEHVDSDLLCYRATHPAKLVALQRARWQPWLDWFHAQHGATLAVSAGVMPTRQPGNVRPAVEAALSAQDDAGLTALGVLAPALNSLVLALAVVSGALSPEEAADLAMLDEMQQAEEWGLDAELTRRHAATLREAVEAHRFVTLSRPDPAT